MRTLYKKCPLCNSTNFINSKVGDASLQTFYIPALPKVIQWKQCSKCNHIFTEGYFEGEAQKLLFNDTQAPQTVGFETERQRNVSSRLIEKVLPCITNPPSGRWLDVGFGDGSLLFTAKEYGFNPIGLDLRKANVELMNGCGIEAFACTIEEHTEKSCYTVISMCDVLEHMAFPKEALKAAYRLLKTSGVLFISCPNIDSMVWQLMPDKDNPYWGEIEHYHNFGRKRLYSLIEEMGFKVMRFSISERYRIGMEIIARK